MAQLPDLRRVGLLALDTETNDVGLRTERGSSWPWRDGHVAGVSVAWREGGAVRSQYIPLRHPDSDNADIPQVYRWLSDLVASDVRIAGANINYDFGWLNAEGGLAMPPPDRLEEVGALAVTVNENLFDFSLDGLCKHYGLPGKDEAAPREAIIAAGLTGKRKKINVQSHLWQLPARFVAPYAEADAVATLALFEKLNPVLDAEGTREAYRLDVDLLPIVMAMRKRGVRIDQSAAEQARDVLLAKRDAALAELSDHLGKPIGMEEISGRNWKIATFEAQKIAVSAKTKKGAPSFSTSKSGWMGKHPHWLPSLIATANKYDAAAVKFLTDHILAHIVGGRIYAEIRPFRAEEGGTRSSRFSYADPPLQQMPSRDEEIGPLIRGCFLPEEGEVWAKPDLSQQEFRWCVHHAVKRNLPGANETAKVFHDDPEADFHAVVATLTDLPRGDAKNTNFAKIYGAGLVKFASMIGKPLAETRLIVAQYDAKMPFISRLAACCQAEARKNGFTRLYDGARRHWSLWEVPFVFAKGAGPCGREEAEARIKDPEHPWHKQRLVRANIYTALNALVQGTSARHTKLWMKAVFREGVVPLLQMHDALDCSVSSRAQGEMIARLGGEVVTCEVAHRVDLKFGHSWGDASHSWEELHGDRPHRNGARIAIAIPAEPEIIIPPPIEEGVIDLAELIGDVPRRTRKIVCPFHDDASPSLHVYPTHYHCYSAGCGAHGDHIDWLTQVEGHDRESAIEILERWDGPRVALADDADQKQKSRHGARALELWSAARPIAGTLAEVYLAEHRWIDLSALPEDISERALRFHPHCPFGKGVWRPCLLALMRDPFSGEATGIQRTALNPDGTKIDRMMLGPAGVVQLWPAGETLVVGEGLETVLAAATRLPHLGAPLRPAWAALGALARFPVIDGPEMLIVLADNDRNEAGQRAAGGCGRRWMDAGRRGAVLTPSEPGTDFSNVILAMRRAL
jgi:DNA polymerase I-like protein with 3'-5' exonuclease and polymerase domains